MIFAVAMTFIAQTVVSIAVPDIQHELGLSNTGVPWAVNAYLLSPAAFFAHGGRLADTVGHRRVRSHLRTSLIARGVPAPEAADRARSLAQANSMAQSGGGPIPGLVRAHFAEATRTVLFCMAGITAVAAVVAFVGLQRGRQAELTVAEG